MFGCSVTGIDLSPSFVEAAEYLTARCGLADCVTSIRAFVPSGTAPRTQEALARMLASGGRDWSSI